ncbi:MAG: ferrochelatase [Armatimonadetes bacterium RBG_16_67_12]|nr:MAG: ferrochelatase [Armatimonadetes bacterium RBG_16_67_12]
MIGVLVMAYGTPGGPDDLEAYYTHIRRGRRPSRELLEELAARYNAIGWSPLNEITKRQSDGLQSRLGAAAPGRYRVYVGMKHAAPFIGDVVLQMAGDGVTEGVGIVLAPHYSRMSIGTYIAYAEDARRALPHPFPMKYVERWGEHPLFLDAVADRLRAALAQLPEAIRARTPVIFSAHSLPERILAWHDPYPDELQRTSAAVAARAGVARWSFAYQSAGRTAEPWLGPDVREAVQHLYDAGDRSVVSCSVGFVTDHLEVLYDLDIEVRHLCERLGMRFVRAGSLNEHPLMLDALSDLVQHRAVEPPAEVPAAH